MIHNTKYPFGCIMDFAKKRGRFNTAESDADAGVRYVNVFGKRRMDGMRKKVDIGQSLSRSWDGGQIRKLKMLRKMFGAMPSLELTYIIYPLFEGILLKMNF